MTMDESLDVMRAEQERRRREEGEMLDPGGRNAKMVREAEDRFCEAMDKWREEKRKKRYPTPWEKDL